MQRSESFGMEFGGHQGSFLNPLFFILVLEALSREFSTIVPGVLIVGTQEQCF